MIITFFFRNVRGNKKRCKGTKLPVPTYPNPSPASQQTGHISLAGPLPNLPGLAIQFLLLCGKRHLQVSGESLSLHNRIITANRPGHGTQIQNDIIYALLVLPSPFNFVMSPPHCLQVTGSFHYTNSGSFSLQSCDH